MPIKAVFFDLDDTLLETHGTHQAALNASCARAAEHHPEWPAETLVPIFNRIYRALEDELEAGRLNFESQLLYRTRTWEETLRECGLPTALGRELAEAYLAKRRTMYRLFEEIPEMLQRLQDRYILGMITNGLSDLQREKIQAVHLERWFPHIAVSGELGSWKPDAGIFHHALSQAGVTAAEAVMVGDMLDRDVLGARNAGVRSVWIRRYPHLMPREDIVADRVVSDLHNFDAVLAEMESGGA